MLPETAWCGDVRPDKLVLQRCSPPTTTKNIHSTETMNCMSEWDHVIYCICFSACHQQSFEDLHMSVFGRMQRGCHPNLISEPKLI